MKKFLSKLTLTIGACLVTLGMNAQVIADFSNLTLTSKTWGTGTINSGGLPSGFQQFSLDGLTPNSQISSVFSSTTGWATVELEFSDGTSDTVALSTSWYDPAGTANDIMICSPVTVPTGAGMYLTWEAFAWNASYADGYQVYVSSNPSPTNPGTLVYTTIGENAYFTPRAVDISNYAGQSIYVTFVNNSNDKLMLGIDDIAIQAFNQNDVELTSVSVPRYESINKDITIQGTITNQSQAVSSIEVTWDDGSGPQVATIGGLNVQPLQTYDFTHTIPFNESMAEEYSLDVTVSKVNGAADVNPADNSNTELISLVAKSVTKNPLIEEGTGTWCGWCPRGAVAMDYMYDTYPDFIGIAVHNGDPMTVTEYDDGADFSGFPNCNADRLILGAGVSTANFEAMYSALKTLVPPVDLSASTFSRSGSDITVNASAEFLTELSDEIRLAAIIVEDDVTGSSAGYNQSNYYAGGGNGAMGGYENLPDPVPAASMVYDHVGRALLGGYDGAASSVSSPIANGDVAAYTFNYTAPSDINLSKSHVVVLAIHSPSGQVLNAVQLIHPESTKALEAANINLELFPNPATESLTISYDLNDEVNILVYDMQGRVIKQVENVSNNGSYKLDVSSLNSGNYMISVSTADASYNKVFTKN